MMCTLNLRRKRYCAQVNKYDYHIKRALQMNSVRWISGSLKLWEFPIFE